MGYPIIRAGNELYSVFIIYEFCILAYLCLVIKFVLLFVSSSGHLPNRCLLIAPCFGTLDMPRRSWLGLSDAYALSGGADTEDLMTDRSYIVIRLACAMMGWKQVTGGADCVQRVREGSLGK